MIGFDRIEYAGLTDVGLRRSHNQDSFMLFPAPDEEQWRKRGHVFLVADGMGGHAIGEEASRLATANIPHLISKYVQEGPPAALHRAFVEANATIHAKGRSAREYNGMGTTATAMLLRPEGLWIAHVGDSRAYRIRQGKIEQLSFDHSLVWEMARRKGIQPEELPPGTPNNIIVRSLGPDAQVQIDIEGPHLVEPGDCYLLCSDGLSGQVSDREMAAVVSALPPEQACRFLIHLANLQGGPDNITAVVLRIRADGPAGTPKQASARFARLSGVLGKIPWPPLALIVGILLAFAAIAQKIYNIPGEVGTLLLAAVVFIVGLIALLRQNAREKEEKKIELPPPRVQVYRQKEFAIDPPLLEKIARVLSSLEKLVEENHLDLDWPTFRGHLQRAEPLSRQGRLTEAFSEKSQAMLLVMETLQKERGREEVFKPMWDQVEN